MSILFNARQGLSVGPSALQSIDASNNLSVVNITASGVLFGSNVIATADTGQRGADALRLRTATTNATSALTIMPNGTSQSSVLRLYNKDDITGTNVGAVELSIVGTAVSLQGIQSGTGVSPTTMTTGLGVTITSTSGLSVSAGTISQTMSGQTNAIRVGQVSDSTTLGQISFNGAYALTTMQGIFGGGGGVILSLNVPTGHTIQSRVNNTTVSSTSATGVVITGTLSTTGGISALSIQNTPIGSTTPSTGAFTSLTANLYGTFHTNVKVWNGFGGSTNNIGIGANTLASASLTGTNIVSVGVSSGFSNTTGTNNTFIGSNSGFSNTTGQSNSFVGFGSGYANTTGAQNVSLGSTAGYNNTTGVHNTFLGYAAGYYTTGNYNTFSGAQAGYFNTAGLNNTFSGYQAGYNSTTALNNVMIGTFAGSSNTTGSGNTFIGELSGFEVRPTSKAISAFADYSVTVAGTVKATSVAHGLVGSTLKVISGTVNYNGNYTITVIDVDNFYFTHAWVATETGWWSSNNEATNNTFLGWSAGRGITTGYANTIIGSQLTGFAGNLQGNIVIGNGFGQIKAQHDGTNWTLTGAVSTTGVISASSIQSTPIGSTTPSTGAFTSITASLGGTFQNNVKVWNGPSGIITNVGVGPSSLSNITGTISTGVGYGAGAATTSGSGNSLFGAYAGFYNTTGAMNTLLGSSTGQTNTTGYNNTFVGSGAGYNNTTGYNNTLIGLNAGLNVKPTSKAISAFADYSVTVAGTVKATSVAHGLVGSSTKQISGTVNYDGSYTITVIDVDNFYFTHAWVSTELGWWSINTEANNNTILGHNTGAGITTGSGNTILGANLTGLTGALTNNIILTNGTGAIKAQHDGTNWTLTGGVSITGNLTINGTTTTVNSTIVTLDDPILTLGGDTAPTVDDNKDRGIEFRWHNGTVAKVGFFGYDDSTGYLTFIPDAVNTSEIFSGTLGDIQATNFRGALIGNASSASLATAISGGTAGDLLYQSAPGVTGSIVDVAAGNALISGGIGLAPSYGKIGLTTHVSGTLPIANGGTGGTTQATALTGIGAVGSTTVYKNGAYNVVPADRGVTFICSGTWTLTTDGAAFLGNGFTFAVVNAGTGIITIDPVGMQEIDALEIKQLSPKQSCFITSNGTSFNTLGLSGGGAKGGAADDVFYENSTTVTADYTITSGKNALSAGPITINNGITVTVPDGSVWTIV